MSVHAVEWKRTALKDLRSLPRDVVGRAVLAVEALATDPRPHGARKLTGSERTYRIRVGEYRVVYSVFDDVLVVEIVRVRHRSRVYRP